MTARKHAGIGLGIDAGGTATRWHLVDAAGATLAMGEGAPVSGHIFSPAAREQAFSTLDTVIADVRPHAAPSAVVAVVAGITGLDRASPAAIAFREHIARRLAIAQTSVQVEMDMVIAYRAAFEPGTGILVYSGTGSIALHVTSSGDVVRAGGRGVIIDDGGSGFWIAKQAAKTIYRLEDRQPGSGFSTPLGRALVTAVGGADWDLLRTYFYGGDRGRIAKLARVVGNAADDGDATAMAVLEAAGRELGRLAGSMLSRLGPRAVTLAGGASFTHSAIARAFRASVSDTLEIRHQRIDSAGAAAVMAVGLV